MVIFGAILVLPLLLPSWAQQQVEGPPPSHPHCYSLLKEQLTIYGLQLVKPTYLSQAMYSHFHLILRPIPYHPSPCISVRLYRHSTVDLDILSHIPPVIYFELLPEFLPGMSRFHLVESRYRLLILSYGDGILGVVPSSQFKSLPLMSAWART